VQGQRVRKKELKKCGDELTLLKGNQMESRKLKYHETKKNNSKKKKNPAFGYVCHMLNLMKIAIYVLFEQCFFKLVPGQWPWKVQGP
jgi:hypothetical protein